MPSATRRLLSGTLSSWMRIVLTISSQIAVTPIFLSHWSIEEYGYWLLFQAITPLIQLVDTGHQTYVGYECLKLGARRRRMLSITTSSAIALCWATGACTVVAVMATVQLAQHGLLGASARDMSSQWHMGALLIAHSIVWVLTGSIGGMITRMLACFGQFARFSWWSLVLQLVNTFVPAAVVLCGYDLVTAALALLLSTFCINVLLIRDALKQCRKHGIALDRPSRKVGWRNFRRSIVVSLSSACDLLRQQGVRLILAPLGGAREVATFSITRTGANFALQGLGTITQPLMPELMGFVRDRDQVRAESAFALVWLILLWIVNPAVLVLQWIGPSLFAVWTHGKVPFDPVLFGLLTADILIFALAQPAIAVVQGNNLTRVQFSTSVLAAFLTVGGIAVAMRFAGIRGAAAALAIVEVVVSTVYVTVAYRWLTEVRMRWPWPSFISVLFSVAVTIVAMLWIAANGRAGILIPVAATLQFIAAFRYCIGLPEAGKRRLVQLAGAPLKRIGWDFRRKSPRPVNTSTIDEARR
jgi:O-antigen/teichoic acid export membrane protein